MHFLDLLFPKRCLTCWRFGKYFCDRCAATVRVIEQRETICPICERPAIGGMTHPRCQTRYSLDGLTSIFRYNGIIREAVKTLKYRLVTDLAKEFVSLIPVTFFDEVTKYRTNEASLIPIPLHSSRFRDRGFNQAEVLGKLLVDRSHIPVRTDILRRVRKTKPQVEMKDRKKRLVNMKHVFEISSHLPISLSSHPTVILFDDVFTTGATMRAAGESLKRAGAKVVWAITMAR
ncbi:ComF family protein [Candidatus Gottesmanbacteria bacterium]|nr:ComF family protein [Candidatus Gottesmanbacteria bacterium]